MAMALAAMDRSLVVTSSEVRATAQTLAADVEARILAVLQEQGQASTLTLVSRVEAQRGSRRDLIEALASLLDSGQIVGTRRHGSRPDWLAGITWTLAGAANG